MRLFRFVDPRVRNDLNAGITRVRKVIHTKEMDQIFLREAGTCARAERDRERTVKQ
jgi:hypothetical protein